MSEYSALLGTQPSEAEAVTEVETPETGTPSGETTEVATETQGEEVEQAETEQAAEADQPDQDLQKLLTKKGISLEQFKEYRERYPVPLEVLNANPSLKHLYLDKIATDEHVAKISKVDEKKPETQDQPVNLEEHFKSISEQVKQFSDPKVTEHFAARLTAAAEKGDVPGQLGILQEAMHNYLTTVLPKLVPEIQNQYQTTQAKASEEAYQVHSTLWSEMREANPDLPEDLKGSFEQAVKIVPSLAKDMDPKERLQIIAAIVGGKKAAVEVADKAAEAGKKAGSAAQKTAQLGKLGAGQSKGTLGGGGKGSDPLDDAIENFNRQNKGLSSK